MESKTTLTAACHFDCDNFLCTGIQSQCRCVSNEILDHPWKCAFCDGDFEKIFHCPSNVTADISKDFCKTCGSCSADSCFDGTLVHKTLCGICGEECNGRLTCQMGGGLPTILAGTVTGFEGNKDRRHGNLLYSMFHTPDRSYQSANTFITLCNHCDGKRAYSDKDWKGQSIHFLDGRTFNVLTRSGCDDCPLL